MPRQVFTSLDSPLILIVDRYHLLRTNQPTNQHIIFVFFVFYLITFQFIHCLRFRSASYINLSTGIAKITSSCSSSNNNHSFGDTRGAKKLIKIIIKNCFRNYGDRVDWTKGGVRGGTRDVESSVTTITRNKNVNA